MDPNFRIYMAPEDEIPLVDKARLDGYLKGREEADQSAIERHGMTECHLFGERIDIPTPIVGELARLRALERQFQDEERDRLIREYEAKYGPLPPPPSEPVWFPVED